MDIEQKQAELIEQYVKRAETLTGPSLAGLIVEATSHPSLFAFAEILSVPNPSKIEGTQYSRYLDMLRLFAHGTWSDYKSDADSLPALVHDQIRKLKQLSVLTLAETNKGPENLTYSGKILETETGKSFDSGEVKENANRCYLADIW